MTWTEQQENDWAVKAAIFSSWHHTLLVGTWPGAPEGSVRVAQFDDPSTPVLLLRPGEAARFAQALIDAVPTSEPAATEKIADCAQALRAVAIAPGHVSSYGYDGARYCEDCHAATPCPTERARAWLAEHDREAS